MTTESDAPLSASPGWSAGRVVRATVFVAGVALGFLFLYRFRLALLLLFVAIVLGTAIRPAVDWLRRRGVPRALGVIMIYVLLLAAVVGFTLAFVPLVADQGAQIAGNLPDYYASLRDMLVNSRSELVRRLGYQLPLSLSALGQTPPTPAPSAPSGGVPFDGVGQFLGYSVLLLRTLLALAAVFLLAFYWTLESERMLFGLLLWLPAERRPNARALIDDLEAKVGGFVRAQTILCFSIGLASLISYAIIRLPYAVLLAALAGVLEAVPVFGPTLGAAAPMLVAITAAPDKVIWVLASAVIIQLLENNLLVPRVMGSTLGVNPIVTMLALAAFSSLLGLPGALLAVPMAAVLQLLLDRLVLAPALEEQPVLEHRDRLARLRYEAQVLAQDVRKQVRQKEELPTGTTDHTEDTIEAIALDLDHLLALTGGEE